MLGKIFFNRNGEIFGENCCTWISFWGFTEIPITMISIDFYCSFFPPFLANFCFINTDNVRFWFLQIVVEIFFCKNRSDSINIPWWNEKFIRCFPSSILPISLIWFSMGDTIAELFGSGFGRFAFLFDNLFWEKLGLFFLFVLWRLNFFGFLIIFFWRHNF